MREFVQHSYDLLFFFQDMDFAHLVFFICIPQMEPIYQDLHRMHPEPQRLERFIRRLTYCRTNLMDGLTAKQMLVRQKDETHYASILHFVWDMRAFYLLKSSSLRDERTLHDDAVAKWNRVDAFKFPDVGTGFFTIMSCFVSAALHEQYTGKQTHTHRQHKTFFGLEPDHVRVPKPLYTGLADSVHTQMILRSGKKKTKHACFVFYL
jgi:hypothetical protein